MGASESSCKPCSTADPVSDTVKLDPTLLQQQQQPESPKPSSRDEQVENPESPSPKASPEDEDKRQEEERLEKERLEEEEERQKRAEQDRVEAEERQKAEEEERTRCQEAEKAEKAKKAEEQAARDKAEAEKAAAKTKVEAWLKTRGFKNLKDPKKAALCGAAAFAFHTAIEVGDTELVRAMLLCDADPNLKNGSGKTAREVAERCGNAEVLELFNKGK